MLEKSLWGPVPLAAVLVQGMGGVTGRVRVVCHPHVYLVTDTLVVVQNGSPYTFCESKWIFKKYIPIILKMLILTNLAEDLSTIMYCILHLEFILMKVRGLTAVHIVFVMPLIFEQ